ncbi:cytidine deaminase [bacterium]|nr:cytidine deaminase [bacterium]
MKRIDKINYYLNIATECLKRGTCLRRNFGAVIVKNDQILSTGYTGAPRMQKNCIDLGFCIREKLRVPRGSNYELCRSVHAEMNAIINVSRIDMLDSTLFLSGIEVSTNEYVKNAKPCKLCRRFIINAGIGKVIVREAHHTYKEYLTADWIEEDDELLLNGVEINDY